MATVSSPLHLYLLRHGKSDWSAEYGDDHDRPLATRGVKAAQLVGEVLKEIGQVPEIVLSSSALRARTTAELAIEAGGWDSRLELRPELYDTSPHGVMGTILGKADSGHGSILLVGHEPTWSSLLAYLIGGGVHRFPTAAVACIRFERESWSEIRAGDGELIWFLPPKIMARVRRV